MKIPQDKLWAGTEQSLQAHLAMEEQAQAKLLAGPYDDGTDDENDVPYLISSVTDGVAVINVKGALTNSDSWVNEYLGRTSYPALRSALVYAATNADIKSIVLDVDSGGGAVNGVADTANLIRMVNDKVKPVYAFAGGSMASAAYWLGCAAGEVYAENTAMVGSIGVLCTHVEYSKQMAADGVTATVVRSGKYKALANSVEPLSAEGKAQLQASVDATDLIFSQHVADMTGKSLAYVQEHMGQGREFIGQAAADVGLIKGVTSFDTLMSSVCQKQLDASTSNLNNMQNPQGGMMKKALTDAAIAAMAEGGVVAGAPAAVVAEPVEAAAPVVEPVAAAAPVVEAAPAPQADVISFLQAQIKEKDAALLSANVELAGLKKTQEDFQSAHAGLMEIACKSVSNMSIALGGSALDMSTSSAVQVLAQHASLKEKFQTQFKAGGVAAVSAGEPEKDAPELTAAQRARIQAARPRLSAAKR